MDNVILEKYKGLNSDGRRFVDSAIKAAGSNPEFLENVSEEEKQEIKRKHEEADRKRKIEDEVFHKYFEDLRSESDDYTEQDYIEKLNELFLMMPWYQLRYFYLFINAKLYCNCNAEGCDCNE